MGETETEMLGEMWSECVKEEACVCKTEKGVPEDADYV